MTQIKIQYSDEQEVIYVFAPDHTAITIPMLEQRLKTTPVSMSSEISRAFYKLISYNQHVILNEGDEEDTWVSLGLGALAADLTGFGASITRWRGDYLDAPHLSSLIDTEDSGSYQYIYLWWTVSVLQVVSGCLW